MNNSRVASIVLGTIGLGICCLSALAGQPAKEKPFGIGKRVAWTTSRIQGSPEPPPPYKIERAFPKLTFHNPLLLTTAPGLNRFFVCEQFGKILSFPIDPKVEKADLVIDLR